MEEGGGMYEVIEKDILIPVDGLRLEATLTLPPKTEGIVIFAHGSGSSRFSPRNKYVASVLQEYHFATLLADLLTPGEDEVYANRFNIDLLTERLIAITHWVTHRDFGESIPVGYFGASTGAASALRAAAKCPKIIRAVVSRGGRPDLAMDYLQQVQCPVLMIVGSYDEEVLQLNRLAFQKLPNNKELKVVEGATHLFEEPGKLEEVARLATSWFQLHLAKATAQESFEITQKV